MKKPRENKIKLDVDPNPLRPVIPKTIPDKKTKPEIQPDNNPPEIKPKPEKKTEPDNSPPEINPNKEKKTEPGKETLKKK